MNMRKRLLSAALAFLMLFAVSCGKGPGSPETTVIQVSETGFKSASATGDQTSGAETQEARIGVAGVRFSNDALVIPVGGRAALSAVLLPENATERGVTFENSDPRVCSYDGAEVVALSPGIALLTAVTREDGYIARCRVEVTGKDLPTVQTEPVDPTSGTESPSPSEESPTPGVESQTPSIESPTPSEESPTPSVESPTPSIESPTPSIESPTPSVESPTPSVESPTPSVQSPTTVIDPPGPTEKRVSFLAAGDNIIHEAVFTDAAALAAVQAAENGYAERYYFDSMYNGVRAVIEGADIAFVNHECPIAGAEFGISGYPSFNSPIESAEALERIGFDVVNVANNHMLDMEKYCTGYRNTVQNLKNATSMLVVGGYTKKDFDELRVIERNGVRVAFLSYTACLNDEEVNKDSPEMKIPWPAEADVRRQTALARANADFVIVSIHWGVENDSGVSNEQRALARLFNECGVDLIIGHHSHTPQQIEWIGEGERRTLCFYSLGNFISTQHPIKNLVGIFASLDLVVGENGEKRIENVCAIPHLTWYSFSRDALQVYLLSDVTKELIETHGSQLRTDYNGGPFTLEDIKRYLDGVLGERLRDRFV